MEKKSLDLVMSSMNLHWVNDLPGTLVSIKDALKEDGCFIGSLLGGTTLQELRYCFYLAEQERRGGVSPHASPLVTPSDMAGLMQGAGFALPTIDLETVTVSYPDAFSLMEHLSLMGEGTSAINRQFNVGRDTFLAVAALYQELYGLEDGSVPATFQTIYVIGWAPHASQPSCKKRGSVPSGFHTSSTNDAYGNIQ
jgi:NADH dehydrogenase [ubiquinone] 1 alpha subcomplex assembly factor 5